MVRSMEAQTPSAEVDATENLSETIVHLIADLEGVDPVELTPPLYSVVDPDALESLFDTPASDTSQPSGYASFHYCGYKIRVDSDGEITILNH